MSGDFDPAGLALLALCGVWGVGWLLKAGDKWRRTRRCGRTGRMRWATR